jgi:zinc protease
MSASAADIRRVAKHYLAPERTAALVYRPQSASVVAANAADMQQLLAGSVRDSLPTVPFANVASTHSATRASLEKREYGVSIFRTASGVPILVRRKPGTPIANIGVYIAGGAVEEPARLAGLTLLTARTMLKGTSNRSASQIAEESEMLGGSISPSAASDSFGWSFSVPAARLGDAVALLGDVIQNPTFPPDALEIERAVALSNVAMLRDDMFRYPMRLASALAFARHPYGSPVMGTEETLKEISLDDLRRWHQSAVLSSDIVIGVVADVEEQTIADQVAREFGDLEPAPLPEVAAPHWPDHVEVAVESRDKAQTAMVLAFPAPSRREPSRFAASLIGTIASGLGGRFFDELRDRQSLAYTVHAGSSEKRLAGIFVSYIATSPEKEDIARTGLLAEFEKLRDARVSDDELTRAKEYTVGSHAISQELGSTLLAEMLDAWMFGEGLQEIAEYETRVRAVTAEEMRDLARDCFDPSRRVEGIVRGVSRTV